MIYVILNNMLIGSGLLAGAFAREFSGREDVCIYAAGVSNSNCTDAQEFARERGRLQEALRRAARVDAFVYFGTCSANDPDARATPYVQHKLAMEQLAAAHHGHLILRLPQVAGKTPNPHTLLNYLYARIARSESFNVWGGARRNIIDIADVLAVARQLLADGAARNTMLNIANTADYPIFDIVGAMERALGKRAVYSILERGSGYLIDIGATLPALERAGVKFDGGYLERVIAKYYAAPLQN
jgi:nucleoside-diphosphate-sugar epimerase